MDMMALFLVSLLVAAISVVNGKYIDPQENLKLQYKESAPWFCHGLDCPAFQTLKTTDEFEIRLYKESMWMSTRITGMDYDKATSEGFMKLFDYIEGDNEEKKKVPMAAPVITRVMPGAGPACKSDFTVSFFVPFAVQPNPPKPSKKDVFVTKLPQQKAYVRSFPGYADQEKYLKEAAELTDALANATSPYHTDYFFTAGYDAPFKPFNRHNEVWLSLSNNIKIFTSHWCACYDDFTLSRIILDFKSESIWNGLTFKNLEVFENVTECRAHQRLKVLSHWALLA